MILSKSKERCSYTRQKLFWHKHATHPVLFAGTMMKVSHDDIFGWEGRYTLEPHLLDRVSAESRQPGGMQHNITDSADCVMHYSGREKLLDMLDTVVVCVCVAGGGVGGLHAPEVFKIQVPGLVGFWEKIHLWSCLLSTSAIFMSEQKWVVVGCAGSFGLGWGGGGVGVVTENTIWKLYRGLH